MNAVFFSEQLKQIKCLRIALCLHTTSHICVYRSFRFDIGNYSGCRLPFYNVLQTLMNNIIPSNEYIGLVNRFEMRPMPLDYIGIAMNVCWVDIKVKFRPIFVSSFARRAVRFSNLIFETKTNLIRIDTKVPKGNENERKSEKILQQQMTETKMNDEYIDRPNTHFPNDQSNLFSY